MNVPCREPACDVTDKRPVFLVKDGSQGGVDRQFVQDRRQGTLQVRFGLGFALSHGRWHLVIRQKRSCILAMRARQFNDETIRGRRWPIFRPSPASERDGYDPHVCHGLMILGGRGSEWRTSMRRESDVNKFRMLVTMLITSAPPTAGQNPDTVKPLTR